MSPEVINLYIDKLLNEINELTKSKLLISTQNAYLEMVNKPIYKNNEHPFPMHKIVNQMQELLGLNKKKEEKTISSCKNLVIVPQVIS